MNEKIKQLRERMDEANAEHIVTYTANELADCIRTNLYSPLYDAQNDENSTAEEVKKLEIAYEKACDEHRETQIAETLAGKKRFWAAKEWGYATAELLSSNKE